MKKENKSLIVRRFVKYGNCRFPSLDDNIVLNDNFRKPKLENIV